MTTIYKYPLDITDTQTIDCPKGSVPLHVGLDPSGNPCLWAQVDTSKSLGELTVYIVGTGHPLPSARTPYKHLGSLTHGLFVWHVFVEGKG